MKFKLILLASLIILALTFTIAGIGQEGHGLTMSVGSGGNREGVQIYVKTNFTLLNVTKVSSVTANLSSVYNGSGTLLAVSPFVNSVANFSINLVAGQNYTIEANQTNAAITSNACNNVATTRPVNGTSIDWINGTFNGVVGANGNVFCNIESITYTNNLLGANNTIYNSSTVETARESFTSEFSLPLSLSSASLIYAGSSYSGSITTLSGNNYRLSSSLDIPIGTSSINWFWNITLSNGTIVNSNPLVQSRTLINFSSCQAAPQNIPYITFTFKNETPNQENVNASVTTSSFVYWDNSGSGSLNKSFNYINLTELSSYSFCYTPSDRFIKSLITFSYDNAESEQRTYSPDILSLSNVSTSKTLFLLPSTQGQYVTFQVINTAQQSLSNVEVVASRSGIGTIETATTDSSGTVTFFLNPNFPYDFVFSKSGFDDFETTITPSQTSYTITMGGTTGSTNTTNSASGMSFVILPSQRTLNNGTTYNFNLTLNSSYWSLSSWGFTLQNRSGYVFDSESSTSSNGGFLSSNLNTGENKTIVMNYFWVINGVYNNATITWGVLDLSGNTLSISQFFTDLRNYVSLGFFGIDDVGLGIVTFFAIFLISGVMSYKFGINSPAAIMAFIFSLTMFFDLGLGLVPNPIGAIPHAPTFLMGIIFVAMFLRELGR